MSGEGRLRVRVSGSRLALRAFLERHPPGCETVEAIGKNLRIDADVDAPEIQSLRDSGLHVEVLFDIDAHMRAVAERVGSDDRFAGGKVPRPRGLAVRR